MRISLMAKKEITKSKAKEYARASKKRKGEILDAICETTGWSRDNARRQLRQAHKLKIRAARNERKRSFKYSATARQVLVNLWAITGQCCGQYLVWQLKEGALERALKHQSLRVGLRNKGALVQPGDACLAEIKAMSSATIDRYLKDAKRAMQPLAKSTTKQASYALRNEVPFGKSYTTHTTPGWLSTDTVAHCGASLRGDHIWTVNSTDTVSGWTETISIKSRASCFVKAGHEELLPRFPFPILGVNYDGGSEFINREMIDYAALQHYQMTRSRPYHSNDNAHVEQKNADIVRRHAFRYRYNGDNAMSVLNELWYWVNLRKNYLVPTKKCIGHTKTKSGRTRGIYDSPKTPVKRILDYDCVDVDTKKDLQMMLDELSDAEITQNILNCQEQLLSLVLDQDLLDHVAQEVRQVIPA